jgi:hypothetical protein
VPGDVLQLQAKARRRGWEWVAFAIAMVRACMAVYYCFDKGTGRQRQVTVKYSLYLLSIYLNIFDLNFTTNFFELLFQTVVFSVNLNDAKERLVCR